MISGLSLSVLRFPVLAAAATLFAGLAVVDTAAAQPAGSYARTCRNNRMIGPVLYALCTMRNGRTTSAKLDVRGCVGDIANIDGRLTCRKAPAWPTPTSPAATLGSGQGDRCHTYATEMVSMDARARQMRCPGWRSHSNYGAHYSWCQSQAPARSQQALANWGTAFQGCRFKMGR